MDGSGTGGAAPGRTGSGHGPAASGTTAAGSDTGAPGAGGAGAAGGASGAAAGGGQGDGATGGAVGDASGDADGATGGRTREEAPLREVPSAPGEAGSPWFGPGPKARGPGPAGHGAGGAGSAGHGAGEAGPARYDGAGIGPTGHGTDGTGPTGHGTDGTGPTGHGSGENGPTGHGTEEADSAGHGTDGTGPTGHGSGGSGPVGHRPFAERYPVRVPLPSTAPRPAPLRGAFRPVTIRTSRDAVAAAAGYLRWLGFRDVVQPEERPASGVDLRGPGLVAQVDPSTRPTGLRAVECLWLNGLSTAAVSVFFSLAGYTPEARSRAAEVGLPLFVLDLTGTPQPANDAAEELTAGGA
ncbi:hypothetical protein ABZ926_21450 [Streptomyces litmocidini]|uniref:hypothetical protein n=1 Tax=Streptomyces litmocidini TaxID=67318 RepID=UPI0033F2C127